MKRWLVLAALWCIPGLIQAASYYAAFALKGDNSLSVATALLWRLPEWQVWALATPVIVWAARRFPVASWKGAPVHLVLATLVAIADVTVNFYVGRLLEQTPFTTADYWDFMPLMLLKTAFFELMVYSAVLIADQAFAYQRRYREAALAQTQLEARLVEAQLDALKHQLHPHFLFNTINAINVLMRKGESAAAIRMLNGMSDLLRRSLTSLRVELVSLDEELDFIARYLDIETTRFPDRLRVALDIDPAARSASIPCMLLQPIVENAIEHGIAPRVEGGTIAITARLVDNKLRIEIRNDACETPAKREGHGVGLSNVRKRLAQLYPNAHVFELECAPSGAVAIIEIPYQEAPCAP
jgi:two-component system LytT family sensor kinase